MEDPTIQLKHVGSLGLKSSFIPYTQLSQFLQRALNMYGIHETMLIYKQGFLFCYKCFYVDDSYKHIGHSRTPNPYEKCHH